MNTTAEIREIRADEIITGDLFDTCVGVGFDLRFARVVAVKVIEIDRPGDDDLIEITLDTDGICPVRVLLASAVVRVA